MSNIKRASFQELLEFANRVREAGQGEFISALMPAIPQAAKSCLIAKNLNFGCEISPLDLHNPFINSFDPSDESNKYTWGMFVDDEKLAKSIGKAMNLPVRTGRNKWIIALPEEIAQVARDFDNAMELLISPESLFENGELECALKYRMGDSRIIAINSKEQEHRELVEEMWPYFDDAIKANYTIEVYNELMAAEIDDE